MFEIEEGFSIFHRYYGRHHKFDVKFHNSFKQREKLTVQICNENDSRQSSELISENKWHDEII